MDQFQRIVSSEYLLNVNEVPPMSDYHSKLKNTDISHSDYQRILKFWRVFSVNNLAEYLCIYNLLDVLLLLQVFMDYVNSFHDQFDLNADKYLGIAGTILRTYSS